MAEDPDALAAMTRILSPHCRVTRMSSGALIADWKRTRFLGMATADVRKFSEGSSQERAELVTGLIRSGCATGRRKEHSDLEVALWLRGVHLLIRTLGFGRVLRLLPLAAPDYARAEPASAEDVARLKRAVQSHGRTSWFVNDDCKAEAVTAFVLLRRRGLSAVLHVGAREHPLAFHAWTSSAGLCIPDANPRGHAFTPVLSINGGGQ
ncbi:lasso peptide biosynthesis B2 protein [Streptomyces glomeratus]|uniref:Microcin J25-processing protein McjB C-terminal domain-containing protein n=1 Tax=Streptomyces glomeratus TaxID=284452 RepID=A0ABP6M3U0_9ACTN|nr:lasso peptide biosynthesis B2 protein [Streptomyces glomeratus]MCF1511801.1 lasso peptide biosynthesis B2 protein [Streptomyces glomeratus]